MPTPDAQTRWWVVFRDALAATEPWHHRLWRALGLLPPGFGHCFAFCEPSPGLVLVYNLQPGGIEHRLITTFAYAMVRDYRADGARVVVAETRVVGYVRRRSLPILTCASVVGALLGVRGWVVTPRGLYRRLIADGGREIT